MAENENMIRFVIQKHSRGDDVHWDLMVELSSALATWRLNTPPGKLAGNTVGAEKIPDHELRFLTYNGPVNDGKGTVEIADSGRCDIHTNHDDMIAGLFDGNRVKGKFCLKKSHDRTWQLTFTK